MHLFFIFQGDSVAVTTAAQGYITVSGVVGAPAARVFSGIALSSPVTTAAKQQSVPGALFVTGRLTQKMIKSLNKNFSATVEHFS